MGAILWSERYRVVLESASMPELSAQSKCFNASQWGDVPPRHAQIESWRADRNDDVQWTVNRIVNIFDSPQNQVSILDQKGGAVEFLKYPEIDFNSIEWGVKVDRIKVKAVLRDTRTGVVGNEEYEVDPEFAGNQLFQWTEGNYSCDCNRSRFLHGEDGKLECSDRENVIELVELWVGGERVI